MHGRNYTCTRCEKPYEFGTGKIISGDPDFYQRRGACSNCMKDQKPLVDELPKIKICRDIAWAENK